VPEISLEQREFINPGVRVHYFFVSWLSVNSLLSPVNGYSKER
jgi:hypothetical protein